MEVTCVYSHTVNFSFLSSSLQPNLSIFVSFLNSSSLLSTGKYDSDFIYKKPASRGVYESSLSMMRRFCLISLLIKNSPQTNVSVFMQGAKCCKTSKCHCILTDVRFHSCDR